MPIGLSTVSYSMAWERLLGLLHFRPLRADRWFRRLSANLASDHIRCRGWASAFLHGREYTKDTLHPAELQGDPGLQHSQWTDAERARTSVETASWGAFRRGSIASFD